MESRNNQYRSEYNYSIEQDENLTKIIMQCIEENKDFDLIDQSRVSTSTMEALVPCLKDDHKETLLKLIRSRRFTNASSFSMTLLNKSKFDFSKHFLSHLMILNSDLSQGSFRKSSFLGSDMRGCLLRKASLVETDMTNCNLLKVSLGIQTIFKGHSLQINNVAISFDNSLIASCSDDKSIKIWDLAKNGLKSTLTGHGNIIKALAFSPVENLLASGGLDNKIMLWRGEKLEFTLLLHTLAVRTLDFSPNGNWLASGSLDHSIKIWDIQNQILLQTIDTHAFAVNSVAFSSDGKLIASASGDRTYKIWDIEGKKCLHNEIGSGYSLESIAFSPNDYTFATGDAESKIRVYKKFKFVRMIDSRLGKLSALAMNDSFVVAAGHSKKVRAWNLDTYELIYTFLGHKGIVLSVTISIDLQIVISGGEDKTIFVWEQSFDDFSDNKLDEVSAISTSNKFIASGNESGTINIWDLDSYTLIDVLCGHSKTVSSLSFSHCGEFLVSGSYDSLIKIWNMETMELYRDLCGHSSGIIKVKFRTNDHLFASGGHDKKIVIWEFDQIKTKLIGHDKQITALDFLHEKEQLVSGSFDMKAILWDLNDGSILQTYSNDSNFVSGLIVTDDDRFIIASIFYTGANVWEISTGEVKNSLGMSIVWPVLSISDSDRQVLIGTDKGIVYSWKIFQKRIFPVVTENRTEIRDIIHFADRKLIVLYENKSFNIWTF